MQVGLSTKNAPSVWVVVPHFLIGAVSFLIASVFLLFNYEDLLGYHINASVLAVLHLMVLGWVSMIIFGALYQLIPVVMQVKLYSEKLAMTTLACMVAGLFFLIAAFLGYKFQLTNNFIIGGSLVITAIVLFAFNTLKSALESKEKSISKYYIMASVGYLALTVLLGLFTVINLSYNILPVAHTELMKTHLVLGLVGWFLMLVIAVAAKLMPMFLIVHKTKENLLRWAFYLINAGILIIFVSVFVKQTPGYVDLFSFVLIFAGLIMFLLFNYDVFSHRMRRKLDIGMKLSAVGLIILVAAILSFAAAYFGSAALGLPAGRIEIISGLLLVYGFFTGLILGQTYKTLPFIIWLYYYQKLVGKQKVPLVADLYSDKLAAIHLFSFVLSLLLFLTGLLFSVKEVLFLAAAAMLFTSLVYGFNVYKMIFHKKIII
ncbi:MAG: hypothetical protein GXO88_00180 [Chlorobi bacterium]|nr:hypothetical protein [Chlorobiota bacterium]